MRRETIPCAGIYGAKTSFGVPSRRLLRDEDEVVLLQARVYAGTVQRRADECRVLIEAVLACRPADRGQCPGYKPSDPPRRHQRKQ